MALASGIVIPANALGGLALRLRDRLVSALMDSYIATLVAGFQLPVQPQFHPQTLPLHPRLHILALDLIALGVVGKGEVVGDDPVLHVAERGPQLYALAERPMEV